MVDSTLCSYVKNVYAQMPKALLPFNTPNNEFTADHILYQRLLNKLNESLSDESTWKAS